MQRAVGDQYAAVMAQADSCAEIQRPSIQVAGLPAGFFELYSEVSGVDAFMNTGLVFPLVLDRTVPYSTLGAGMSIMRGTRAVFTLMVFDTHCAAIVSTSPSMYFRNSHASRLFPMPGWPTTRPLP